MREGTDDQSRRMLVWVALSDLFLDTELGERDLRYIAAILVESGFSNEELQEILFREVYPVCIGNLRHPAGVWAGFNPRWVEEEVGRQVRQGTPEASLSPPDRWMIEPEWQRVTELLAEARRNAKAT